MKPSDSNNPDRPLSNLVFRERDLRRVIQDLLNCSDEHSLDTFCGTLTKYQFLQVVTRLVKQKEPACALAVLARADELSERLSYQKLQALIDLERYEEAEAEATELLSANPNNPVVREKRRLCRKRLGKLVAALDDELYLLEKFRLSKKRIHQAYVMRGWQRVRSGELELGQEDLNQAERAFTRTAESLRLKGEIAYAYGDFQDAIFWLTEALDAFEAAEHKGHPIEKQRIHSQRSYALQKMGRYHLALLDLDAALGQDTGSSLTAWTYWQRANLLKRMNRKSDALSDVKAGLALSPQNFHLQALLEELQGSSSGGRPSVDKDSWQCLFSRALFHLKRGELEQALRDIEASARTKGDSLQLNYWKALLLQELGRDEESRELLASISQTALAQGMLLLWASINEPEWKDRLDELWYR